MQVVPSPVDVASSAELLGRLTIADDHVKPVASNVVHARTSTMEATAVAAEAMHICSVKRLYVTTPLKDIDRISTLPFSSSVNQSEAAQQLVRTTKSCFSGILMLCDERNSEGLRSDTCVPGWEYPLRQSFERAITPDKPTTSPPYYLDGRFFWAGVARPARWSLGA